ncbi:MAG: YggS family pyridoxal phosphate-dependent enzyme, partial [Chlamydiae bacterium]|nr:YggS family pyridoxal phosphate-dependent enzyme [Chlamydiota bacterium]
DALEKKAKLPLDIQWHFIGRIQSNKISKLIGEFALIQSIESTKTARLLSQKCIEKNCIQPVLLQVNLSGEATKQGFSKQDLLLDWEELCSLKGIRIDGLMTMAPHVAGEETIRACFSEVRALKDLLNAKGAHMTELSMGMSGDYEMAIAEGSTIVRIGSALFGESII